MKTPVDRFFDKATRWQVELREVRKLLGECGLEENLKWGKPCYSFEGKNVAILQPMKDHLSLMFFKGELMSDPKRIMAPVGPNSRSARRILFRSASAVNQCKSVVKALVKSAIAVERAGLSVEKPSHLALVEELQEKLTQDKKLAVAFSGLTPGRQREYNLYFSAAKQSSTRARRIENCVEKMRAGKGVAWGACP